MILVACCQCLSATICLVLGKWIQESNAKESRDVITLYNKAIHFQPKWEKAHFLLGKYYDELLAAESNRSRFGTLHSKQQQQQQPEFDQRGRPLPPSSKSKVNVIGASPDVVSKFLGAILKSYGSSLTHGHKYLFQSMPRILTLWFEHSENHWDGTLIPTTQIGGGGGLSFKPSIGSSLSKSTAVPNSLPEKFSQCHSFLCDLTKTLPAYQWLTAFPQIISRLTHKLAPVYAFIKDIILKVFADYPQQALWLLAPVNKSVDAARRSVDTSGMPRCEPAVRLSLICGCSSLRMLFSVPALVRVRF
jgi:serine/threonine-protein kinase ATR